MRIKDTKANKIFMLLSLIVLMFLVFSPKFARRSTIEQTIDYKKGITIESVSANINIWIDSNLNDAKIEYSTKDSSEIDIDTKINGETIIKEKNKNKFINLKFDREEPTISLYLPNDEIEELTIKTLSGNIETYNAIELNTLSINSTSGDINLLDVDAKDNLVIKTISANINLQNTKSNQMSISSTSGNIEAESLNSNDLSIISTSGKVYIDEINSGKLKINSTSGDIEIDSSNITESISLSVISGDIDFITADKPYKYDVNSISGDITINNKEYETSYSTKDGIPFNIKSISGEISIFTK